MPSSTYKIMVEPVTSASTKDIKLNIILKVEQNPVLF